MSKIIRISIGVFIAALVLTGAAMNAYAHENKERFEGNIRYTSHIAPMFEKKCSGCHGKNSAEHGVFSMKRDEYIANGLGPRMDSYSLLITFVGWPDTGSLMRRLDDGSNTVDGKPGNMYKHLGKNDHERKQNMAVFKDWVGTWSLKHFNMTKKDDLTAIKVPY